MLIKRNTPNRTKTSQGHAMNAPVLYHGFGYYARVDRRVGKLIICVLVVEQ